MDITTRLDELEATVRRIDKQLQPKKRKNPSITATFNVTSQVLERLKSEALAEGLTRSELLRRIVNHHFQTMDNVPHLPNATVDNWHKVAGITLEPKDDEDLLDFT